MHKEIPYDLINKYLKGQCNDREKQFLLDWYEDYNKNEQSFQSLSAAEKQALKGRMLNQIKSDLDIQDVNTRLDKKPTVKYILYSLMAGAAILLIVFSISINIHHKLTVSPIVDRSNKVLLKNLSKTITRKVLSDGSTVWLSPNSNFQYPKTFTGDIREVSLEGEAFFEITKDEKRPFIIYSGDIITKVWGTSFLIKALKNSYNEVSVLTGKVSVKISKEQDSEIMLLPNQKCVYNDANKLFKKENDQDASPARIWKKTTLSFNNVPMNEVIRTLNKKFRSEIEINDKILGSYELKADFTDQSLPSILAMLEKSLDINYQIDANRIILSRNVNQ